MTGFVQNIIPDIKEGKEEALDLFSIDDEKNLVTATWNQKEDGTIEIKENAPVNLKSTLEKYVMPYEYLLYFYIDTNETGFSEDLADKIIKDTEIVIAVQDNVTTTETVTTVQERREDEEEGESYDWKDGEETTTITESCSTTVGITYVNTWCVKAYQENSYSTEVLEMEDQDSKVINIKGKVNESKYQSLTDEKLVEEGTHSEQIQETNRETGETETRTINYKYKIYNRDKIDTRTISNSYEQGELKTEGKENTFVKAYQTNKMHRWVRTAYLFKIMENNERTKNMVDLTKYLIFKATNINYGKVEFDFSEFSLESFTTIGQFYGGTIQEKVWFALRNAGYSEIATAAVMGNIEHESGFDPSKIESGNSIGFGLCQWSFGRRKQLEAYAASKGVSPSDIQTQIEFLLAELTPGGGANGYATDETSGKSSSKYDGTSYTRKDWTDSEDIDKATIAFMALFERPSYDSSINHIDRRRASAKEYYEQFKGKTAPSGVSGSSIPVSNGTSEQKLQYLFPNGKPTTADQCKQYMQTITVPLTTKNGTKTSGNLTIHKALVQDVQEIFQAAQNGGFKIYEAMGYSFRKMNNGGTGNLSHHSYGVAIDINVTENYSHRGSTIYAGSFWDPSRSEFSIPRDGILVKAFEAKGWKWGGNWSGNYQDYMHFSFTGN